MRALVTGGAGFIGSHIAGLLLERGWEVRILDNFDRRVHRADLTNPVEGTTLIRGDVLHPSTRRRALAGGVDVVFHQAAVCGLGRGVEDAETFLRVNVTGTLDLLRDVAETTPRPSRVVLASSMALYGEGMYECDTCSVPRLGKRRPEDLERGRWEPRCPECGSPLSPRPVTENHPPSPATMYARSKWLQEMVALEAASARRIPLVALRYHNVYGARLPRDTPYAAVASMFRSSLAAGRPPVVHEDGRQLRDFVHVSDIARANLLAAEVEPDAILFEAFNIGTGSPHRVGELAEVLTRALAPRLKPQYPGTYRPGDARHVFAAVGKARERLGFRATVAWEEGMTRFAREPLREPPREAIVV